jgi:hypothetical protein
MLLAVGSTNRRAATLEAKDANTFFAAVMLDPTSSNTQQFVRLIRMDENVQWNVCPALTPRSLSPSIPDVQNAAGTNLAR